MKQTRIALSIAMLVEISLAGVNGFAACQAQDMVVNGGFEAGTEGWSWGQWKGLPEPGFVDKDAPHEGKASYTMTMAGMEGGRSLYASLSNIDPARDYELSLALRAKGLPENSVGISFLQWGTENSKRVRPQGWVCLPGSPTTRELIVVGGAFGWQEFKVHIYRQSIKPTTKRLTLYIEHTSIGQGELSIDAVALIPVDSIAYRGPVRPQKRPTLQRRKPTPQEEAAAVSPAQAGSTESKDLLLSRCDSTQGWALTLGNEFPGAKGELTTVEDSGRNVLRVGFDLSGGGRYVGAVRRATTERATIGKAEAILFDVRGSGLSSFGARVRDATGQTHAASLRAEEGAWRTIALPLTKETFGHHWGGAKDGKIHFPLRGVVIASNTGKRAKGSFLLRNFGVRRAGSKRTWNITVTTDRPGHIHFVEEPKVNVSVRVLNGLREQRRVPVTVEVVDVDGEAVAAEGEATRSAQRLSIDPWSAGVAVLSLDSPGPGYYHVRVSVGEGALQEHGEGAFGVVPRPLRYRQRDPESFFGMHSADPAISPRLGVHWFRYYQQWRWREYHQGQYDHPTERLQQCVDAGIDILMCLVYQEPRWLKPRTKPDGLPTAEAMQHYADFVRSTVRAHPFVAVYETMNEPDLMIMAHRNLSLAKALEFYTGMCKTILPIIREGVPGIPIAGSAVSGQDQKSGFRFSRGALGQMGDAFDIWSPHPYASPRTFGPGLAPLSPEDNRETDKHRETLSLIRELGGDQKYWVGEKGWEIKDEAPLLGMNSLSFADYCARSLIIAKSVPGVQKYFWFTQTMEHAIAAKYPLLRGEPLQPMPAAVAYANVAHRLDHARPVESLQFAGGGIRVCVFDRPMTKTAIAALWSVSTPYVLAVKLPDRARVFGLYGREVLAKPLQLTETPLFIQTAAADARALLSALKQARFQPAEPFQVVAAYLADVRTVRVGLRNNTSQVVRIEGRAVGAFGKIALLPNREEPSWLQIDLPRPVTDGKTDSVPITLSPRDGKPVETVLSTDLVAVARKSGIAVDGRAGDWQGIRPLVLNKREQVLPPDEAGWMGPQDLSVRVYSAWDDQNLYLLVRVTDDVHTPTGRGSFWKKDCLQIAIDVMNDASPTPRFDANDREYGVLIDDGGAHTFQTHPRLATFEAEFPAAGRRVGSETLYEMAFPWSQLGRQPRAGMVFSLNLTAIDNDGAGANYCMGLTPGIVEGKRPAMYREFYLAQ